MVGAGAGFGSGGAGFDGGDPGFGFESLQSGQLSSRPLLEPALPSVTPPQAESAKVAAIKSFVMAGPQCNGCAKRHSARNSHF